MSGRTIIDGASVPFLEARLPWSANPGDPPSDPRTFLLYDSLAADGRFVLYSLATQVCNKSATAAGGRVLWLACGPVTQSQIRQGQKKMGCSNHIQNSTDHNDNKNAAEVLTIQNVVSDMASRIASSCNSEGNDEGDFDVQAHLQEIYRSIYEWATRDKDEATQQETHVSPSWLLVDDVSALASLCGERRIYSWLLAIQALSTRNNQFGILLRANGDNNNDIDNSGFDWFGAGATHTNSMPPNIHKVPWERTLVELADGIIDVLPLTSGYTRDVHGRLLWTCLTTRGWRGGESHKEGEGKYERSAGTARRHTAGGAAPASSSPLRVLNFCITDDRHKVMAYIL